MGRTNPTFRAVVDGTEQRWQAYRRALRHRDVEAFDRLFAHARAHADAGSVLNHDEPLFPILVSVDLEQERRLTKLEQRVAALEDDRES